MALVVAFLRFALNILPPHDVQVLWQFEHFEGFRYYELCIWRYQQPRTYRCLRMAPDGVLLPWPGP